MLLYVLACYSMFWYVLVCYSINVIVIYSLVSPLTKHPYILTNNLLHHIYHISLTSHQQKKPWVQLRNQSALNAAQDVALWTSFGPSKGVSGAIESRAENSWGCSKMGETHGNFMKFPILSIQWVVWALRLDKSILENLMGVRSNCFLVGV
jgi:hypothetical protein